MSRMFAVREVKGGDCMRCGGGPVVQFRLGAFMARLCRRCGKRLVADLLRSWQDRDAKVLMEEVAQVADDPPMPVPEDEREPCSVVDSHACQAPPGLDEHAKIECWHCGDAVCGECSVERTSSKEGRVRWCANCIREEEWEAQMRARRSAR